MIKYDRCHNQYKCGAHCCNTNLNKTRLKLICNYKRKSHIHEITQTLESFQIILLYCTDIATHSRNQLGYQFSKKNNKNRPIKIVDEDGLE